MVYRKNSLKEKIVFFCRLCKCYWITVHVVHNMPHAIWVDNVMGVMISKEKINKKLKGFFK